MFKFFLGEDLSMDQIPTKLHEISKTFVSTDTYVMFYVYNDKGIPIKLPEIPIVDLSQIEHCFDHYEEKDNVVKLL